jgi:ribosomal protein L40E
MRCKNCGWPNKPEATTCSKCGSPLESSQSVGQFTDSNSELKKTIREDDVFGNQPAQPNICPKCSYPLRPGTTKCPNCQTELNGGNPIQNQQDVRRQAPRRPTVLNAPKFNGTVNVWTEGSIGITPSFVLSPVKRNGERHDPEDVELEGEEVVLNRENTDPGNMSITSKTQAIITRKDDQWYIEDKSEQRTTFIQANTPQPLKDGDIILLGNRLFVFHE